MITLTELYRRVPQIRCQGKCTECCGPIVAAEAERRRMVEVGGPFTVDWETMTCGYLKDGCCSVYAVRPLICRLWGVADPMICEFGCTPERVLTREEGAALFDELGRIGGKLVAPDAGPDGPKLCGPEGG